MKIHAENVDKRSIAELVPYARNSRTHSPAQIKQIEKSIQEFGWTVPVLVDEAGTIIAGHGRVMAASNLGIEAVPVVVAAGWTEDQKRAYIIADNKIASNADWDKELLALELSDLKSADYDLGITGFNAKELVQYVAVSKDGLTDEDEVPEPPPEPVSAPGDVWLLGAHRVMCGDSTSIEAVEKLMDGMKADMVFTDPPYNIDYQGVKDKREKIKNDKMSDRDFVDFLSTSLMACETMYVCCSWHYAHLFRESLERIARKPKAMIVWDKVNPAQNLDKYYKQHEIIFYYGDYGGHKTVRGDVWTLKRQKNTVHPTMKPVELIEIALADNAGKKTVYDGFGGSGSTLIACEKTDRACRMMELDPKYVDVIIKRWQAFTGKQAVLESDGKTFDEIANARH